MADEKIQKLLADARFQKLTIPQQRDLITGVLRQDPRFFRISQQQRDQLVHSIYDKYASDTSHAPSGHETAQAVADAYTETLKSPAYQARQREAKAYSIKTGAKYQKSAADFRKSLDIPLLNTETMRVPGKSVPARVATGAMRGVSGMTTPTNMGIMGGLGGLAVSGPPGTAAATAIGSFMIGKMLGDAYQDIKHGSDPAETVGTLLPVLLPMAAGHALAKRGGTETALPKAPEAPPVPTAEQITAIKPGPPGTAQERTVGVPKPKLTVVDGGKETPHAVQEPGAKSRVPRKAGPEVELQRMGERDAKKKEAPKARGKKEGKVDATPVLPKTAAERPGVPQGQSDKARSVNRPAKSKPGSAPVEPKPASTTVSDTTGTLPHDLQRAAPRYSYGPKQFLLNFKSNVDRAAYITAQAKKSPRDADFRTFLRGQGMTDAEIDDHGAAVRAAIKAQAKTADPGTLTVDEVGRTKTKLDEQRRAETKLDEAPKPVEDRSGTHTYGSKGVTHTADNTPVKFKYALVPLDQLRASHTDQLTVNPDYDSGLQPRDRSGAPTANQRTSEAARFIPATMGQSPYTNYGAPIIGQDNMVESGNGRVLGLRHIRSTDPSKWTNYQNWLMKHAEAFGLKTSDIQNMKAEGNEPVLVRVRQGQQTATARHELAEAMGKDPGLQMTSTKTSTVRPALPKAPPGSHVGGVNIAPLNDALTKLEEKGAAVKDTIQRVIAPAARSQGAARTARSIRANEGELVRRRERVQQLFDKTAKWMNRLPLDDRMEFMFNMDEGLPQATPALQKVADVLRDTIDSYTQALTDRKILRAADVKPNYFPRRYRSNNAPTGEDVLNAVRGKRPLEGSKRYLKGRTYETFRESYDANHHDLETTNPVEMVMNHLADVDRLIMAHDVVVKELRPAKLVRYVRAGKEAEAKQAGWAHINDRMATVFGPRPDTGGRHIRGYWMAPEPVATVLNSYLSPSLRYSTEGELGLRTGLRRMYVTPLRSLGNHLNMAQLGLSAYHMMFTALDAANSQTALGIRQLLSGDVKGGARNLARPVGAAALTAAGHPGLGAALMATVPAETLMKGSALRAVYRAPESAADIVGKLPWVRDPGTVGGQFLEAASAITQGGGRFSNDAFYRGSAYESFRQALVDRKPGGVVKNLLPAVLERVSAPIMDEWVPRMKAGVAYDMARADLELWERRNPGSQMNPEQMRKTMQAAWDSVDNRLGQMVYDNLFWDKALKDIALTSIRSVGWNLGTFREYGGAVADTAGIVKRVRAGDPVLTHRMAYAIGATATTMLAGAITTYLYTGKPPHDYHDYFHPRTGRTDPVTGNAMRIDLPTYMKDFPKWADDPGSTAAGKINPGLETVRELLSNEDYYGKPINADSHAWKPVQGMSDPKKLGEYILNQFMPFSLRQRGSAVDKQAYLEQFFGLMPNRPTKEYKTIKVPLYREPAYSYSSPMAGLGKLP